ncbi:MAG: hypothetical protein OXG74_20795 [Acidobacteria bacterium]|nr:hypothetical protein [Acidobacteriota bacterium]
MSTSDSVAGANGPRTMEEIRESLRETAALMAELREQTKETDRRMRETDRQMKETDRRLKKAEGLFTTQWGKLMESLVEGDLVPLLRERGIDVTDTMQRVTGRRNGEHYEFDIVAANGEEAVVVEVKTTLRPEDVADFLDRMSWYAERLRSRAGQTVYGAVAYRRCDESVVRYAERKGLFVIRATGSSASIVNPPDFEPRVLS